jgi:hypothetical protein
MLAETTEIADLQVFSWSTSPLTDSNRRPPPYHSAPRREAGACAGNRGHENPANGRDLQRRSDRKWTRVPSLVFPQRSLAARVVDEAFTGARLHRTSFTAAVARRAPNLTAPTI